MRALPEPSAAPPVLFGTPTSSASLLAWSWACERLAAARTYWIGSVSPVGRPHSRPVWGVWLDDGFWFSTGSLARRNLIVNPLVTVHLGDGDQVVIVEGEATLVSKDPAAASPAEVPAALRRFVDAYNDKYDWDMVVMDEGVGDAEGAFGPLFLVRPRVVFGWAEHMRTPTRWSFG